MRFSSLEPHRLLCFSGSAIIMASGQDGKKLYSTSDENGNYRLNLTKGDYTIEITYMGYEKSSTPLHLHSRKKLDMNLKPALFEVDEVTVRSIRNDAELAEITPSRMLSFSGNGLFSQIRNLILRTETRTNIHALSPSTCLPHRSLSKGLS